MFSLNKDTFIIFAIILCFLGLFYLYRDIQKVKKVPVHKQQSMPMPQVWNQAPVYDTKPPPQFVQAPVAPPPSPVTAPVSSPVPAQEAAKSPEQK